MQCPKKKIQELRRFLRSEALQKLLIAVLYHGGHGLIALPAFGQNVNQFSPPVVGILPQGDEFLLLQTGQQPGYGGVA